MLFFLLNIYINNPTLESYGIPLIFPLLQLLICIQKNALFPLICKFIKFEHNEKTFYPISIFIFENKI